MSENALPAGAAALWAVLVMAALELGRAEGLDIAVRGGGHSVPGFGTVDVGNALVGDHLRHRS